MKFTSHFKALSLIILLSFATITHSFEISSSTRRNEHRSQHRSEKKAEGKTVKSKSEFLNFLKLNKREKLKKRELVKLKIRRNQEKERKIQTARAKSTAKFFLITALLVTFLTYAILKIGNAVYRNAFVYPLQRENLRNVSTKLQKIYEMRLNTCSFALLKNVKQRRMNTSLALRVGYHIMGQDAKCSCQAQNNNENCIEYCKLRPVLESSRSIAMELLKKDIDLNDQCGWIKTDDGLSKLKTKYTKLVSSQKSVLDTMTEVSTTLITSLASLAGIEEIKNAVMNRIKSIIFRVPDEEPGEEGKNSFEFAIDTLVKTYDQGYEMFNKAIDAAYTEDGQLSDGYKWFKNTIAPWVKIALSGTSGLVSFLGKFGPRASNIITVFNNFLQIVYKIIEWHAIDKKTNKTEWDNMSICTQMIEINSVIVSIRWSIPQIFMFFKLNSLAVTVGLAMDVVIAGIEIASTVCYHKEALDDQKKIEEIFNKEMKTTLEEKCKNDLELMKDALNKQSIHSMMTGYGQISSISQEAIKNLCHYSLSSCLTMDAHEKDQSKWLFSEGEYQKFYQITESGPISEIAISSSYQTDDQFEQLGFFRIYRTFQNMNAVYARRGSLPNTIITKMCIDDSSVEMKDSQCFHEGANLTVKRLRIKYDKILTFVSKKLVGTGKCRYIKNIAFLQAGDDLVLKQELKCLSWKEVEGNIEVTLDEPISDTPVEVLRESIRSTSDNVPQIRQIKQDFCDENCIGKSLNPSNQCMRMYWAGKTSTSRRKKFRESLGNQLSSSRHDHKRHEAREDAFKAVENGKKFKEMCQSCPSKKTLNYYITKGDPFVEGDSIYSLNRKFMLIMKEGVLQIQDTDEDFTPVWFVDTKDKTAYAEIDSMGYFKIISSEKSGSVYFKSDDKCRNPACRLILNDYGSIELVDYETYRVVYSSSSIIKNYIEVGDYVENQENSIFSSNKKYFATVKDTGVFGVWNFSDANNADAPPLWQADFELGDTMAARARLVLKENGNLELLNVNNAILWSSRSMMKEKKKYRLLLSNQGKLKIINPTTHETITTIN